MIIFDGYSRAAQKEAVLKKRLATLQLSEPPVIAALLFTEDAGSQLYTRLKAEAAGRVGIGYETYPFSLQDDLSDIIDEIHNINSDPHVTGLIIQKPSKSLWLGQRGNVSDPQAAASAFQAWWSQLVTQIDPDKDVDGLHPKTLAAIEKGTWEAEKLVMPATARAIMDILSVAACQLTDQPISPDYNQVALLKFLAGKKITVLGKSDIVGKPVYFALKAKNCDVEMIGSQELKARIENKTYLLESDVIISSTGRAKLITGELIKPDTIVIDVGEPKPDVDQTSVATKALFLTPVPGGVGPMTVVSLLENALALLQKKV